MKTYNTGESTWKHGDPTNFERGIARHKLLGPCPDCGSSTFNYGGGWRCNAMYCIRNTSNPAPSVGEAPDWWNTDINVMKDGNAWCAFRDGFINLQESDAAYGETPNKAVRNLIEFENGFE